MKERPSLEIAETKFRVFSEQSGRCFTCGEPIALGDMELAHRISQSKVNLKLWGEAVIHHRLNLRGTHAGRCNSRASLNPSSREAERLVYTIQKELKKAKERRYAR
jgi:5-methylcytosine-specific restriction endonuclease McrA